MTIEAQSLLHQVYRNYVQKQGKPRFAPPYKGIQAQLFLLSDEEKEEFSANAIEYLNHYASIRTRPKNSSELFEEKMDEKHSENIELVESFSEDFEVISELKRLIARHQGLKDILDNIEKNRPVVQLHYLPTVESIAKKLDLNSEETLILNIITIASYNDDYIRSFPINTKLDRGRYFISRDFLKLATNFSDRELSLHLSMKSKLRRLKIIEITDRCVQINSIFKDYLLEESDLHIEGERIDYAQTPSIESFKIPKVTLDLAVNLLKAPGSTSILLAGSPGTGKSTLATALTREAGLTPWALPTTENLDEEENFRESILATALYLHATRETVLIVDEADALISTSMRFSFARHAKEDRKAWFNQLLDTHQAKVIFICNDSFIDESTMRRFKFTLNFKSAGPLQRREFWRELIKKNEISYISENDIKDFAERFDLSMGIVAQAIQDVARLDTNVPKETLEQILTHQLKGIKGIKPEKNKAEFFDERFVKTNFPLSQLIKKTSQLHERGHGRLSYLFTGLPGTGKTAFAKHVAREAGYELMIKSYADLSSKYVGEAEKLIQSAFNEAEEMGMALFIDEVDSLLQNRSNANRHWEVTQVNQFLTALENFDGLFIAATNFKNHLDPAAMRRFTDVVEFTAPDLEYRLIMVKVMLKNIVNAWPSDTELRSELSRLNITPGDVHAIRQSMQFDEDVHWYKISSKLKVHKKKEGISFGIHQQSERSN